MEKCSLTLCSLPVAGLFVAICFCEGAAGQERKAAPYKTPQEAFTAALNATMTDNWKAFYECLSDDSRDLLTCFAAVTGFLTKELTNPAILTDELKAVLRSLNETFKTHGLTDDHMNRFITIGNASSKQKSQEELKKETQEMLKPVKNRRAFITDTFVALRKLNAFKGKFLEGAELKDLRINGESATGIILTKKENKELRLSIGFKRIDGSWEVDLPDEFFFPPPALKKLGK
jgi:hypothetical protein